MTIRDNRDYIWVLLYSYHSTITGWGVLLTYMAFQKMAVPGRGLHGRDISGIRYVSTVGHNIMGFKGLGFRGYVTGV